MARAETALAAQHPTGKLRHSPQSFKCRIEFAPLRVSGFVCRQVYRIRFDTLCHFNRLPARRVKTVPVSRANAGHQRTAKRASLFSREHFHRLAVNTRLNLAPKWATRPTAAKSYGTHRDSQLREERKGVLKGIRHAFKHCAREVPRSM